MPQLKSGRHYALSAMHYLDALASEKPQTRYYAMLALRLHALTPGALRDHLAVGYFIDGEGAPPDAPCYNAGYCVADVLEGRAGWTQAEIDECRNFLESDSRFAQWLQEQHDQINVAIRDNPVWNSPLCVISDDDDPATDIFAVLRTAVMRAALDPESMRHLRSIQSQDPQSD